MTRPVTRRTVRYGVALAVAVIVGGAVGGCGGGTGDADGSSDGSSGTTGMDMTSMNEPGATPADQVEGDVRSGRLRLLATAPPGSDGVRGRAWLAQDGSGTTVTVRLRGLQPDVPYVAHLHEQPCGQDDGGEHFAFDPEGSELPPNEVHLGFAADGDGVGEATVTHDRRVGQGAPAVVVHPADAPDNRLSCADLT